MASQGVALWLLFLSNLAATLSYKSPPWMIIQSISFIPHSFHNTSLLSHSFSLIFLFQFPCSCVDFFPWKRGVLQPFWSSNWVFIESLIGEDNKKEERSNLVKPRKTTGFDSCSLSFLILLLLLWTCLWIFVMLICLI